MSPLMALCWEFRAGVSRADEQWCSLITTRRWSQCMGCTGTVDAEVQRSIKRAESTACLCFLRKANGPTMVHVDSKGIIDGLWRGEQRAWPQKRRTPTCGAWSGKNLHRVRREGTLVEGRARQRALVQEERSSNCRSSNKLSLRAMRRQTG